MRQGKKIEEWILENKKSDFDFLSKKYQVDPVLIRLMKNRGIESESQIEKYLYGNVEALHDPHQMKDLEKAASLLLEEIKEQKSIAIATDFDNDGLISGYILSLAIEKASGTETIYAPNRITEGYGLNRRIVDEVYASGSRFIITCDNGIAAIDAIQYAKQLGIKVVVTDHHEVGYFEEEDGSRKYLLPEADAIVNPKQRDCAYPFQGLCGAGVVFKVIEVFYELAGIEKSHLYDLLQFVAIATVADVMDLVDENRILVKKGLEQIKHTKHLGLRALMEANQIHIERISAYHIGFVIGPCFNAAGRLDTVYEAFHLLQARNEDEARRYAIRLKELNDSRKEMTQAGLEQAFIKVETEELWKDNILLVLLEDTHESLAGIIAGKLKEYYNKPCFVFTATDSHLKGSGRSIPAYSMFEELCRCKDLLLRFGGHPMAAGLSLEKKNLALLRERLNTQCELPEKAFVPVIRIDADMPIDYISEELIEQLELLEPFGKGNTKPVFAERHFTLHSARRLGKNQNVLKLMVGNAKGRKMDALYFGDIDDFHEFLEKEYGESEVSKLYKGNHPNIDVALTYYPCINEYMGMRSIQIVIQNYCRIPSSRTKSRV